MQVLIEVNLTDVEVAALVRDEQALDPHQVVMLYLGYLVSAGLDEEVRSYLGLDRIVHERELELLSDRVIVPRSPLSEVVNQ